MGFNIAACSHVNKVSFDLRINSLEKFRSVWNGSLNPALVICSNVVPSGLKFITDGPHKVGLYVLIEYGEDALTKAHDLIVGIEGGVNRTRAFLDS